MSSSPALEVLSVTKRFGGIAVVDDVSLALAEGEVLALVGENGAGKSTLVNLICGLYRPDAGEVRRAGVALPPSDARAALQAGIGVVYQHFMLVGPLTVWENVVLGREPRLGKGGLLAALGILDRKGARREVADAAERFGLPLDVDARVESLGVGAQQRVEILKQLWRGARVLLLDEPTAVLGPREADELVRTVRGLAAGGRSLVFISHKLREVLEVADCIAVLRRGRLVRTVAKGEATAGELAEAALGVAAAAAMAPVRLGAGSGPGPAGDSPAPARDSDSGPRSGSSSSGLVVRDLRCDSARGLPALRGLALSIAPGELVGLAGVDGNGQSELAEVLTGLRRGHGQLSLAGAEGLGRGGWANSPAAARAAGVAHLPEDRHRMALCLPLTVEENLALGHQGEPPFARGVFIDGAGRRARAESLLQAFDVRPPDPALVVRGMSGGNQQKLVAAREIGPHARPRLVVAVQPTRGLDVGAARRVHDALRAARDGGASVLVASLDLDELRALASRILVIFDGRIVGAVGPDASDDLLGRLMLGQGAPAASEAAHG